PNVFSNRPEDRQPPGSLVLVLIDMLNSQPIDQVYVRQKAFRYLADQAKQKRRIAIFGLNNGLVVVQDFTSDPNVLAAAVEKFSPQKSVAAARGEAYTITPQMAMGMTPTMLNALKRLNQEQVVNSIDDRVHITLASLNAIARSMMGYPGRKNLVWVSEAFPASLALGAKNGNLTRSYTSDVRETATLLAEAQIAVYPVDARGLPAGVHRSADPNELVPTIVSPGESAAGEDAAMSVQQAVDASHMAMEEMAHETGGKAFYNANDLDRAVASGMADGND